jgi:pyruvate/2-oxoglutarate dehydrogenase complex dihydrolipoamide acyltransferase (E2) component
MATSAESLAKIIDLLSNKFKFDNDKALAFLAKEEVLPKKLIPKSSTTDSIFASKKAEELATQHGITPQGEGSGKDKKFTLTDIKKLMEKPAKTKFLVSPSALNLANEKGLSLHGKKGSGTDGRILLKDVEKWLAEDSDDDEDDIDISPRARQEATENNISDDELKSITGSGSEGRILLSDVKKYISESDKSDKSDDDDN